MSKYIKKPESNVMTKKEWIQHVGCSSLFAEFRFINWPANAKDKKLNIPSTGQSVNITKMAGIIYGKQKDTELG